MRIIMERTQDGSPDGITVLRYHQGEEYDAPDTLAHIFLGEGWAREVVPEPDTPVLEEKDLMAAPENKRVAAARDDVNTESEPMKPKQRRRPGRRRRV
jgi:hypothetical protein